jgi:hypothetical protein
MKKQAGPRAGIKYKGSSDVFVIATTAGMQEVEYQQ